MANIFLPVENSEEFAQKLGKFIARLRLHLGYSQEDFADVLDVHRTYLTIIERGKVLISLEKTRQIAAKLNLSLARFFTMLEDPEAYAAWEAEVKPVPKKPRRSRRLT
ncbi:MAG: helix-turn-helix domain-containing protein [Blastocatellia bacterium]|nr:helix-turn-helix domain-containing protein [Blastocatellia bacterium]